MKKRRLTILLDKDDFDSVSLAYPEAMEGTILAFDVDIHVELLSRNIKHLTCWDVIEESSLPDLEKFEAEVQRFWNENGSAPFGGIDCLKMAGFRHITCFTRLAWAAFVIKAALNKLQPDEVIAFDEPKGHGLEQPPGYTKMPLLFALLRGMAEQAGITVHLLSRSTTSAFPSFVDQVAVDANMALPSLDPGEVIGDKPYILFTASGSGLTRQIPLLVVIGGQTEFTALQMYKSADTSTLQQLADRGFTAYHEFQLTSHIEQQMDKTWLAAIRQDFDEKRCNCHSNISCIFDNPYMNIHFDFIYDIYIPRMVQHIQTWQGLFNSHRPSLIVANYHGPVIDVAASLNIPTIVFPHGVMIIGETRFYTSLPESTHIGALSEKHKGKLVSAGIAASRITVTGDPACQCIEQQQSPGGRQSRNKILICTCITGLPSTTGYLPQANWAKAAADFQSLASLAARKPEWRFTIRCHPRWDHYRLYEYVNEQLDDNPKIQVVTNSSLEEAVQDADIVVIPNVKSSALIEASFFSKPVIFLDSAMCWYDHLTWATECWPKAGSVEELELIIEEAFDNPARYDALLTQTMQARANFYPSAAPNKCTIGECLVKLARSQSP